MKKIILLIIVVSSLTLYFLSQSEDTKEKSIYKTDENSFINDNLIDNNLKDKLITHREKVIKKVIGKKLSANKNYKKLIANDKKENLNKSDIIKDDIFIEKTFTKFYDCHKDGCGEQPDHDGYFNAGQSVAIESINQILELTLMSEDNDKPSWLSERQLFELLSVENKKTRSLSLAHLLKRSSDAQVKEMLHQEVSKLDGYNFSDAIIGMAKYDDYTDSSSISELLETGFKQVNNHAVIETIHGLKKQVQINEEDFKKISSTICPRIQDINAKKPIIAGMNQWATHSRINLTIEQVCNK